ncbi:MAG: hypothetical protein AB7I30_13075 [Isosphaeraceae bacterium]
MAFVVSDTEFLLDHPGDPGAGPDSAPAGSILGATISANQSFNGLPSTDLYAIRASFPARSRRPRLTSRPALRAPMTV